MNGLHFTNRCLMHILFGAFFCKDKEIDFPLYPKSNYLEEVHANLKDYNNFINYL